jgi:hypothetical protein
VGIWSKIVLLPIEKAFPGTNRRLAVFKIAWRIVLGIFSQLVSLITLPQKKLARTLKWAVSTRLGVSYNLCSKLVSKHILFSKKIMVILVLPDHFWILTAFS